MKSSKLAVSAAGALAVMGCSGGGGGVPVLDGGGGPTVLTGQFADSPVEGLAYRTATQTGVTDAAGTFRYLAGETITFSIGDTVVGSPVTGASVITPRDLVPGAPLYATAAEIERAWRRPKSTETLAFLRFASILVFLQSLDEDADPANGITIRDGIPALFSGDPVDFDTTIAMEKADPYPFSHEYGSTLRRTLRQAVDMGLASTAAPRKVSQALDHFYNEQGAGPGIAHLTGKSVDLDADSDPGVNETVVYAYDAAGNPSGEGRDFDGDGVADTVRVDTYDIAGNRTRTGIDYDGDSAEDEVFTYDYDADGRLTGSSQVTRDGGGSIVFSETRAYAYDSDGYRVSETVISDFGDESSTFEYDVDGNLVRSTWDNGVDTLASEFTYDQDRNLVGETTDYGPNGIVDESRAYEYDAAGNLVRQSADNNGDGSADRITTATYNADGNPTSESFDNDGDGVADVTVVYDYDADGNLAGKSRDADGDGNADYTETFVYDTRGAMIGESGDTDGDGVPDYAATYSYDGDGNVIGEERDSDGDGVTDMITTLTYENGRWSSIQQDLPHLRGL